MTEKTMTEMIAEATANARRQHDTSGRPRYKNGYRSSGTIKMYCRPSNPTLIQFVISFDVVERWHRLRERNPKANLTKQSWTRLRAHFTSFQDVGMPGILVKLEPYTFWPVGYKMAKTKNAGWQFTFCVTARKIGLKNGIPSRTLEYLPIDEFGGDVLIFEEHELLYAGDKYDIKSVLADKLNPTDPS